MCVCTVRRHYVRKRFCEHLLTGSHCENRKHTHANTYWHTQMAWKPIGLFHNSGKNKCLKIIFYFIKCNGNSLVSKRIIANSNSNSLLYIAWSTTMPIFPCNSFRVDKFTSGLWRVRYPDQMSEEWDSSSTSEGARNKKGLFVTFFIFETHKPLWKHLK
jgi:hypothetical protein